MEGHTADGVRRIRAPWASWLWWAATTLGVIWMIRVYGFNFMTGAFAVLLVIQAVWLFVGTSLPPKRPLRLD